MAKPAPLIIAVCSAVCVLLGEDKPDWATARRIMGKGTFLPSLVNFDKDHIEPSTLAGLQKYVEQEEFKPEAVGRSSKAAMSLCMWVVAMNAYGQFMAAKATPVGEADAARRERAGKLGGT